MLFYMKFLSLKYFKGDSWCDVALETLSFRTLPENATPMPKNVGVMCIMNYVLWFALCCILLS